MLILASCAASAATDPALEAKVDAYVAPYLESHNFSGSVLIARGGTVLVSKGYGMANYELDVPNTPHTKFQIASVSKPFTAAAILLLEERGKLKLKDPLAKFIRDYPQGDKITIHDLLAHSSGILNANNLPGYNEKSRFHQSLEQVIAMFKGMPLLFQPGEKYDYSNSNYNLLACIIEKASGEEYGDFLRRSIFEPLGMNDTGEPHSDEIIRNHASGYAPRGMSDIQNAPYLDWSIKTGNGSLYSSVEDLYKFDRALYTDKLLGRSSRDLMFKEHFEGVGYAWFIGKKLNRRAITYSGRSPGYTTALLRFVDDDATVILASNIYSSLTRSMADDLAAILFGEPYRVPELTAHPLDKAVLSTCPGRYQFGPDFIRPNLVIRIEARQRDLAITTPDENYLIPQSDGTFIDRGYGGKLSFSRDEKGKVTQLTWSFGDPFVAKRLPD
jgi:CubicO group peptidase (beta-lactamase class C family)